MWKFILLGVLLLFAWLLFTRLSLQFLYTDEFYAYFKVYFIKIRLFKDKNQVDLKQFSAKGISKKLEKDKKKEAKQKKNTGKSKKTGKDQFTEMIDSVKLVSYLIKAGIEKFLRYLKIKVARFTLIVASDDAAKTAIQYGLAVQAVQYIVALLENSTHVTYDKHAGITVDCDYVQSKPHFAMDIILSLRIWQILAVLFCTALSYLKASNNKEKQGKKEKENADLPEHKA